MGFRIGERVVCVDTNIENPFWVGPKIIEGEIYTISGVQPPTGLCDHLTYLIAEGKHIRHPTCDAYYAFHGKHFRPLQETGMSILKAILANPHKQLETVE